MKVICDHVNTEHCLSLGLGYCEHAEPHEYDSLSLKKDCHIEKCAGRYVQCIPVNK